VIINTKRMKINKSSS